MGVVTTVMINWRMTAWIAAMTGKTPADISAHLPLWTENVLNLAIWSVIEAGMIVPLWLARSMEKQIDNVQKTTTR